MAKIKLFAVILSACVLSTLALPANLPCGDGLVSNCYNGPNNVEEMNVAVDDAVSYFESVLQALGCSQFMNGAIVSFERVIQPLMGFLNMALRRGCNSEFCGDGIVPILGPGGIRPIVIGAGAASTATSTSTVQTNGVGGASVATATSTSTSGGVGAPLAGGVGAPLAGGVVAPLAGGVGAPLAGGVGAPLASGVGAPLAGGVVAPSAGAGAAATASSTSSVQSTGTGGVSNAAASSTSSSSAGVVAPGAGVVAPGAGVVAPAAGVVAPAAGVAGVGPAVVVTDQYSSKSSRTESSSFSESSGHSTNVATL